MVKGRACRKKYGVILLIKNMKTSQHGASHDGNQYTVVLVHGWLSTPRHHWFPWLKKKLSQMGFEVLAPAMPNPIKPDKIKWLAKLEKIMAPLDPSKTIIVGHSLGVPTILYFLQKHRGRKFRHVVLVSGLARKIKYLDVITTGYDLLFDWKRISNKARSWTVIHGDKDPIVPLKESRWIAHNLKTKLWVEKGQGHFTQYRGVFKLSDVLRAITGHQELDQKTKNNMRCLAGQKFELPRALNQIVKFLK